MVVNPPRIPVPSAGGRKGWSRIWWMAGRSARAKQPTTLMAKVVHGKAAARVGEGVRQQMAADCADRAADADRDDRDAGRQAADGDGPTCG